MQRECKFDPEAIDDENPEWTDEDFARARPAREVMPEFVAAWEAARASGTPIKVHCVVDDPPERREMATVVSLTLDKAVLDRFQADGPGWEDRINATLRKAVGL